MPDLNFKDGVEEAASERSQLPKGWYKGHMLASYFQDFKNGNGVALVFDFQVDNGGLPRRIRSYNTWAHRTSPDAEKWGQVAVKQFLRACGKPEARSTEECHNLPIEILVEEGEKYNRIKSYRKVQPPVKEGVTLMTPSFGVPREAMVEPETVKQHAAQYEDDDVPF